MAHIIETELKAPNGRTWSQPRGLFIDNEFVASSNGQTLTTIDPATEAEICSVYAATEEDVNQAVQAARRAFRDPSWCALSGTERGRLLFRLADLVEENRELLATIETLDNGKPYSVSFNYDLQELIDVLRFYAGYADKNFGQVIDVGPRKMAYTLKEPFGVCGQIIPWNYPLDMAAWKLGPALCCGNTVVLKIAEQTPLSALYLARLIREAGFPPGVVNILNGYGRETGAALVRHPGVDKVAFTGSTATGKEIMKMAAETMKNITLETGGKSPLIIFEDANLDQAVRWSHEGLMSNAGQICTATSRLLVHESIVDAYIEKFKVYTKKISVIGSPFDESTQHGPQITEAQYRRVLGYIRAGQEEGASIVIGGKPAKHEGSGFFIEPTMFSNVTPQMKIYREEIFGPCGVIVPFRTEQEALDLANDSEYGLGAALFTRDLTRAHRVARKIEAGMVWINSSNDCDARIPFGGVKQSGIGRELGEAGLTAYCNVKAVHVNMTDE